MAHRPEPNPENTGSSPQAPSPPLNSVRRAASTSRTSGRFAVDPPGRSLTPTPYPALPNNRRKDGQKRSTDKNSRLTGPAPSGMTAPKLMVTNIKILGSTK